MRYSLNKRILFMINLLLLLVFSLLFFTNSMFMGRFYTNHKRQQIISIADTLKKNNYNNIRELGEKNNLKIEILNEDDFSEALFRFTRGPFPIPREENKQIKSRDSFENNKYQNDKYDNDKLKEEIIQKSIIGDKDNPYIKVQNLSDTRKLVEFKGKGRENKERMIILVEKIDDDKYLLINSFIYAIGEALRVTNRFIINTLFIAIILSIIVSIIITKKISKPILEINKVAHDIADLDFSKKLTVHRNDELGDLANSINKMSDSLKNTIENLKVSNERLKQEISKEKQIDKMRREFISNVNHELKTPIALIKGFTEGLKDNIASEEDRDYYLDVIEDECNNMDALVQRFLLLSKYESEFEIEKNEFDIRNIISDLEKRYKYDLEKKKLKLTINVEEDFLIIADQKELKIAVDNLLRNAITYTEEGNTIEILCQKIENRNIFSMKNPYKEISQEEIEKLWIAFNKEDKARTRKFGGTGLGLSIIAAIMKKHDFSYGALYEDGKMKFYFYEERA